MILHGCGYIYFDSVIFTFCGMLIMTVASSKEIEDAYADGFIRGYEVAKEESKIKWVE